MKLKHILINFASIIISFNFTVTRSRLFKGVTSCHTPSHGACGIGEQKIHTRARKKEHEAVLRSMNMKKDSPHSFTDASVPKKKGSAGPVQERRESATIYDRWRRFEGKANVGRCFRLLNASGVILIGW